MKRFSGWIYRGLTIGLLVLCFQPQGNAQDQPPTMTAAQLRLQQLRKEGEQALAAHDEQTALLRFQAGLTLAQQIQDARATYAFAVASGIIYELQGQIQMALTTYQQALPLIQAAQFRSEEATLLQYIGASYQSLGQSPEALACFQAALTIARNLQKPQAEGILLKSISTVYYSWGDARTAFTYAHQALAVARNAADQTTEADVLNTMGMLYQQLGQTENARNTYQQALTVAQATHYQWLEAAIRTNLGTLYAGSGQSAFALEQHQQALQIARAVRNRSVEASALINLSTIEIERGGYAQARAYSEQALAIVRELKDRPSEGKILNNLGIVARQLGDYSQALEQHHLALEIARTTGEKQEEAHNLDGLGTIYTELAQYQTALTYYTQALTIARNIHDQREEGILLNNIGRVYQSLNAFTEALDYYQQAVTIQRAIGNIQEESAELANIGSVYLSLGESSKAIATYEQALGIHRQLHDRLREGNALSNLGNAYRQQGAYQQAVEYYQQAVAIFQELGNRREEGNTLTNLGDVYWVMLAYQDAQTAFQASAQILTDLRADNLWKAQRGLAYTELALNQPERAMRYLQQAIENIEAFRGSPLEERLKISLMTDKIEVYDELIGLLATLHRQHPQAQYDTLAFDIFERKQGRLLLEAMGQSGARRFGGLPEDLFRQEYEGEQQLAQTRQQLGNERSKLFPAQIQERIQQLEERENTLQAGQQALQENMQALYPDYYALRYPQPITLTTLQHEALRHGEVMLVYNVMRDQTVLWVITQQDVRLIALNCPEEDLRKDVEMFRQIPNDISAAIRSEKYGTAIRLSNETLQEMTQQGYRLYQKLLPEAVRPFLNGIQTIYIIPTGPLYELPFEALVTDLPNAEASPHYLIHDYAISYLSSASLLNILRDAQARRAQTQHYPLLAFANPVYTSRTPTPRPRSKESTFAVRAAPQSEGNFSLQTLLDSMTFESLPETEHLAQALSIMLDAPQDSDPLQLREDASKQKVIQFNAAERLDDYQYVLFAAHAVLPNDVDALEQPALVLSHPETEDGYLTMAEVFGLHLNADLVVLSACNTGRGTEVRGEGVMGLTRAFMFAGTSAVSVTLWPVDSNVSYELSTRLFRHLKEGQPLAAALRQAKRDLLQYAEHDDDVAHFRHPFFWAPFVMFGDGR